LGNFRNLFDLTKARSHMRALWGGFILVFAAGIFGALAITYTFDCTDTNCGAYLNHSVTVTVTNETFTACSPVCKDLPWWGQSSLAEALANSMGFRTGSPQFAFSTFAPLGIDLSYSAYSVNSPGGAAALGSGLGLLVSADFVTNIQDNSVPEIDQGTLPKAILLVVSLLIYFRRRVQKPKIS
jgi:hypothetical protein